MKSEIKKIENFLQTEQNVLFGYVFGSYANGKEHDQSDIDVVLFFDRYNFDVYADIVHRLERLLHKKVDLVVLNNTKNLYLLEDIIKNSILVKDHLHREDFELKRMHEILDFKELNQRLKIGQYSKNQEL